MLSSSWNEIARRNAWVCLSCSVNSSPQLLVASSTVRSLPSSLHQRRPSSSKSLNPPKNEHRSISTPSEAPADAQAPAAEVPKRSSTRLRRKTRDAVRDQVARHNETRLSLPSVPSTQHLHPLEIHVASFFSIHRPISVTTALPPKSTDSAFSSIFSSPEQRRNERLDVIYTLSAAVDNIEDIALQQFRQAESNVRDFDVQQPQTTHISLQELAKNFRPFVAPPTPVPMDPKAPAELSAQRASPKRRPVTRKEYTTTLTITESTYPNGHKTYRARTSPITGESVQEQASDISKPSTVRQPFLNRMRERHRQLEQRREKGARKEIWRTISVKRRRKLKMKKHKYKKLMRRTRTRREGKT